MRILNLDRSIISLCRHVDISAKLLVSLQLGQYHRIGPFLDQQFSCGRCLHLCVLQLQKAMAPQMIWKYTDEEHHMAMLTWCLGGWQLLHAFHSARYPLPPSPFLKGHERAPQPYNLFGIITITISASILGAVCDGLRRCPWALHFDEAALKRGLYVASGSKTPHIIGLCECACGKRPYEGVHSIRAVLAELAERKVHLPPHPPPAPQKFWHTVGV